MKEVDKTIQNLINILDKQFFINYQDDCESERLARHRQISLNIAIQNSYSLYKIKNLIYLDKFGIYENEHDIYEIKRLLVNSLIHIDIGGNLLIKLAFDKKLEWDVRFASILALEFIGSKSNILKLKELLNNYSFAEEEIWIAVLNVFSKRPIFELLDFLKSLKKINEPFSIVNDQILQTILDIENNY